MILIKSDGVFSVNLARAGATASTFTVKLIRYTGETYSFTLAPTTQNTRFYTFTLSLSTLPSGQYNLQILQESTLLISEDALIDKPILEWDLAATTVDWNAPTYIAKVWILAEGRWNDEGVWVDTANWID